MSYLRLRLLSLALGLAALAACGSGEGDSTATGPSATTNPSSSSGSTTPAPTSTTSPAPTSTSEPVEAGPPNPYAGGQKIEAPANQWTYVPMADFVCGNGSTSGVAVNPSSAPNAPLLVFFMGGGACWDNITCLNGAASNVAENVGEANIMGDVPRVKALFDREQAANPFKDASFVFIPYCTGDLHAGDAQKSYSLVTKNATIRHRGARNSDAVVKRLLATYPATPKVYVTGASGGGYGAMLNFHRFRTAWPTTRIDILNDCGPPVNPLGSIWKDMLSTWKLELPPGCTGCADEPSKLLPYLSTAVGTGRMALLDFTQDKTIRSFTGRLLAQDFEQQIAAIKAATGPRQRMYIVAGDDHVLLKQDPLPVASSGVGLYTWLTRFATDDAAWAHEGP